VIFSSFPFLPPATAIMWSLSDLALAVQRFLCADASTIPAEAEQPQRGEQQTGYNDEKPITDAPPQPSPMLSTEKSQQSYRTDNRASEGGDSTTFVDNPIELSYTAGNEDRGAAETVEVLVDGDVGTDGPPEPPADDESESSDEEFRERGKSIQRESSGSIHRPKPPTKSESQAKSKSQKKQPSKKGDASISAADISKSSSSVSKKGASS